MAERVTALPRAARGLCRVPLRADPRPPNPPMIFSMGFPASAYGRFVAGSHANFNPWVSLIPLVTQNDRGDTMSETGLPPHVLSEIGSPIRENRLSAIDEL